MVIVMLHVFQHASLSRLKQCWVKPYDILATLSSTFSLKRKILVQVVAFGRWNIFFKEKTIKWDIAFFTEAGDVFWDISKQGYFLCKISVCLIQKYIRFSSKRWLVICFINPSKQTFTFIWRKPSLPIYHKTKEQNPEPKLDITWMGSAPKNTPIV